MTIRISAKLSILFLGLIFTNSGHAELKDFKLASGSVLIAAPTALNGPTIQGIWFFNSSNRAFSLELPQLPPNQVYEAWLVDACTNTKTSAGIFRAGGGIDSDAAGMYAGPFSLDYPPVPGSDFVTLGDNLADGGHSIVITVEPYPDTDPNPSSFLVLETKIPPGIAVGSELQFENISK